MCRWSSHTCSKRPAAENMLRRLKFISGIAVMLFLALLVSAEQRFPPPDFDSGYSLPSPPFPPRAPSGCNTRTRACFSPPWAWRSG